MACAMSRRKWERYSCAGMSRTSSAASSSGTTLDDLMDAFPPPPANSISNPPQVATAATAIPTGMAGRHVNHRISERRLLEHIRNSSTGGSWASSVSTLCDSPEYWSDISLSSSRSSSSFYTSSSSGSSNSDFEESLLDEVSPLAVDEELASDIDLNACHTYELIHMVSYRLSKIVAANDAFHDFEAEVEFELNQPVRHSSPTSKQSAHWDSLTTSAKTQMDKDSLLASFSAGRVPPISIEKYLLQIDRVVHVPNAVLLAMLVYLDRMAKRSRKLNLSGDSFVVNSFTVHRLVLAGILAATKYHSDVTYTVGCYARVSILFSLPVALHRHSRPSLQSGGVSKEEVRQLEWEFLLLNNFEMGVSLSELQQYAKELAEEEEEDEVFAI